MTVVTEDTLNANRLAALDVTFGENGSIYNIGFNGVPQKPGEVYAFYMFAKSLGGQTLTVSVRYSDGAETEAQTFTLTDSYARYDGAFTGLKLDGKAQLVIRGCGSFCLGFTSLTPNHTFMGHGLREDITACSAECIPPSCASPAAALSRV